MVLGLGTDVVSVERVERLLERHGPRFLGRCFRPEEVSVMADDFRGLAPRVAARWAAKEAFLKALGTDVRMIPYRDVEVVRSPAGPISLQLHGRAAIALRMMGGERTLLSISHERQVAVATVLIEGP